MFGSRTALIVVASLALVACSGGEDEVVAPLPPASPPQVGECDFTDPVVIPAKQLADEPPKMDIRPDLYDYSAVLGTSCGDIRIDLLEKDAPVTVNNFVHLTGIGWFDGLRFQRLADSVDIIQVGDPTCLTDEIACGSGGPGYKFDDELTGKEKYEPGTVAMANQGRPDTNGSQFFIVTGPGGEGLPPKFTIFGKVADQESLEVAQLIQEQDVRAREDAPPGAEADFPVDHIWLLDVKVAKEKK